MSAAIKLTDAKVEAVKPASARHEVRDALAPGLRLIVQPSGFKSWAFRYVVAGRDRRLALGDFPAVTLDAARKAANAARAAVLEGRDPAADKSATRATVNTIAAAFEAYDAGHLKAGAIGEATAAATRSFFVRRVLPVWGARPAGSITRQDVVALLDTLNGFADARRKGKTRLSHFFGWTMDRNALVTANPAAGVQTATPASRERILTDDELRAVWNACDQVGTFGAVVRTMILTMARRSEVAEMPVSELSDSLWSIDGTRTKNGRPHDIHRTAALNAVLASVPAATPFQFEGRHHGRPIGGYSDLKTKLDAAAGDSVAPWTLHDLRRTSASLMQRLGVSFEVREACLNHTIKGVAGVYSRHNYEAEKAAAFEALAAKVAAIAAGGEVPSNVVPMTRPMA